MQPYCAYMSDILTTVKEHSVYSITQDTESFTVEDILKRVKILMDSELKKNDIRIRIHNNFNAQGEGTDFFVKVPFTSTGQSEDVIPFQNVYPTDIFETHL